MKVTRHTFTWGLLALLSVLACFAIAGHPLISPELLAGFGVVPLAAGQVDMSQIKEILDGQGNAFSEFMNRNDREREEMKEEIRQLSIKAGRPAGLGGAGSPSDAAPAVETWIDTKTKARVPVLEHKHSLAQFAPKAENKPSFGRVLRGLALGGQADDAKELEEERKAMGISTDPSGGYTVPSALAMDWVDLMRANMVLSKAGVRTVPMETNTLTLARLTGDPTVSWHGENAAITASDATLGAVTLYSKTAVCLVKLSLELAQDSANIEDILQSSIVNAMAQEVDRAGLVGVTTNAGAAPMTGAGILNLANRNSVTTIGAPTSWDFLLDGMYELLADNVPMESIGAMVAHPALWKKMAKLKTGLTNDNTPLPLPDAVARTPKLWTTAAPTDTAMIANWRDMLMGVRKDIQVQVLREAFMGSNLQLALLAYVRVDFAATRAQSFCSLEDITV